MIKELTSTLLLFTSTISIGQSNPKKVKESFSEVYLDSLELLSNYLTAEVVISNNIETLNIGDMEITSENSRLLNYRNGDLIPLAWSHQEWSKYTNSSEGCAAYVYFDSACVYGIVYNGFVVADERNIAPEGYHVATIYEYRNMANSLDTSENAHLDLKCTMFWETNGTNKTGFNALPTGYYSSTWSLAQTATSFWTSTPTDEDKLYHYHFDLYDTHFTDWYDHNMYGFCIRYVKD